MSQNELSQKYSFMRFFIIFNKEYLNVKSMQYCIKKYLFCEKGEKLNEKVIIYIPPEDEKYRLTDISLYHAVSLRDPNDY